MKKALINIIQYCLSEEACGHILEAISNRVPQLETVYNKLANEWEENLHPRANDGKFTSKGEEGGFGEVEMGDLNSPENRRRTKQQLKRMEQKNTPEGRLKDLKKNLRYFERQMAIAKKKGWMASDRNPEGGWMDGFESRAAKRKYERSMRKRDEIEDQIDKLQSEISASKAEKRIGDVQLSASEMKDPEFDKYIAGWVEEGMIGPGDEEKARKELALKKRQGLKGYDLVRAVEADWGNYE